MVDHLVSFSRFLRARGIATTVGTTEDMTRALELVDATKIDDVRAAFRSLAATSPDKARLFDRCFDEFFGGTGIAADSEDPLDEDLPVVVDEWTMRSPLASEGDGEEEEEEVADRRGASAMKRLAVRDFSELTDEELEEARRLIAAMAWAPSNAKRRRWHAGPGRRPDMRATMRKMVGPTADLVPLQMSERRFRQRPLIVIADVSGSMEAYAEMMLTFGHAARARLGKVESFVFSTSLSRITWELSRKDIRQALAEVAENVDDWSGGTKIGEAIGTFNRDWSRRICRGGPIVLIVSDGWDCGPAELLHREMGRLARSVHQVIWLNPLAGRAGYAPETKGMRTAMPHIDHFIPAASVSDLAGVIKLLESTTRQELVAR